MADNRARLDEARAKSNAKLGIVPPMQRSIRDDLIGLPQLSPGPVGPQWRAPPRFPTPMDRLRLVGDRFLDGAEDLGDELGDVASDVVRGKARFSPPSIPPLAFDPAAMARGVRDFGRSALDAAGDVGASVQRDPVGAAKFAFELTGIPAVGREITMAPGSGADATLEGDYAFLRGDEDEAARLYGEGMGRRAMVAGGVMGAGLGLSALRGAGAGDDLARAAMPTGRAPVAPPLAIPEPMAPPPAPVAPPMAPPSALMALQVRPSVSGGADFMVEAAPNAASARSVMRRQFLDQVRAMRDDPNRPAPALRYGVADDGQVYVWDGNLGIHGDVAAQIGKPFSQKGEILRPEDIDEALARMGDTRLEGLRAPDFAGKKHSPAQDAAMNAGQAQPMRRVGAIPPLVAGGLAATGAALTVNPPAAAEGFGGDMPDVGPLEALGRGLAYGGTLNVADEVNPDAAWRAAFEQNPALFTLGQTAGSLLPAWAGARIAVGDKANRIRTAIDAGDDAAVAQLRDQLNAASLYYGGLKGGLSGFAGVEPGEQSLEDRLIGGGVGSTVAAGVSRAAPYLWQNAPVLAGKPATSAPYQLTADRARDVLERAIGEGERLSRARGRPPSFDGPTATPEEIAQTNPVMAQVLATAARDAPSVAPRLEMARGNLDRLQTAQTIDETLSAANNANRFARTPQEEARALLAQIDEGADPEFGADRAAGLRDVLSGPDRALASSVSGMRPTKPGPLTISSRARYQGAVDRLDAAANEGTTLTPAQIAALSTAPLDDPDALRPLGRGQDSPWENEVRWLSRPDQALIADRFAGDIRSRALGIRSVDDVRALGEQINSPAVRSAAGEINVEIAPKLDIGAFRRPQLERTQTAVQGLQDVRDMAAPRGQAIDVGSQYTALGVSRPASVMDLDEAVAKSGGAMDPRLAAEIVASRRMPLNVYGVRPNDEPMLRAEQPMGLRPFRESYSTDASKIASVPVAILAEHGVVAGKNAIAPPLPMDEPVEAAPDLTTIEGLAARYQSDPQFAASLDYETRETVERYIRARELMRPNR